MMEFNLYRKSQESGKSKDWGIAISPDNNDIHVRFCATGKTARLRVIKTPNANQESQKRIQKKLNEGYRYIGKAVLKNNRFSTDIATESELNLYYRARQAVEENVLEDALEKIGALPHIGVTKEGSGWSIETGCDLQGNPIKWKFGDKTSDNLAGKVDLSFYGIVPILFLMLIREECDLTFANDSGDEVVVELKENSEWFQHPEFPFSLTKEMAQKVGLILGPIDYAAIASKLNNQAPAVWF